MNLHTVRYYRAALVGGLVAGSKVPMVLFDDVDTSETYAEQVEYCPACGRLLERKNLSKAVTPAG